jgi:type 1 glutamine amidotransferase
MTSRSTPFRAHVVAGGYPPGAMSGHDHDYARLRLLEFLRDAEVHSSVSSDFGDVGKWLPVSRLLITYVAGPYPNDAEDAAIRSWLAEGGHWLGLHGTSGGKAARISPESRRRRMVKTSHHETLGGFFINHPPIRRFRVDVTGRDGPLTRDLPASFEVIDEPYMIEVQQPQDVSMILTAELPGDPSPPGFGFEYGEDTALLPDGRTRAIGFSREYGRGGVTYIALGHCHDQASNTQPLVDESVAPGGKTPPVMRSTWETPAFERLIRNAIAWGMGD